MLLQLEIIINTVRRHIDQLRNQESANGDSVLSAWVSNELAQSSQPIVGPVVINQQNLNLL